MKGETVYCETVASHKTEALFLALMIIFCLLSIVRSRAAGLDAIAITCLGFVFFFLFYSLNYKTLVIHLTRQALRLKFGIFQWTVPAENIAGSTLDELPGLLRYGGAGIHFMLVHRRYRASFNFLEYPRVVVGLRRRAGLVQDISFSTRQPDEWIRLIQAVASAGQIAPP